jgi:hypothetical protein
MVYILGTLHDNDHHACTASSLEKLRSFITSQVPRDTPYHGMHPMFSIGNGVVNGVASISS